MKKKQVYNPYSILEKRARFTRLMLLATVAAALVGTLVFFPLTQILDVHGAPSFVKYILHYLSEILSNGALFAVLALVVAAVAHEDADLYRKTLLWEVGSIVVISFALRIFVYWLTAYLDSVLSIDFKFNDQTLFMLYRGGELLNHTFSAFFGVLTLFAVLFLSFCLVKRAYRQSHQRGIASLWMKRIPILVYLTVTLVFAVIETVLTILDLGISGSFDVLLTLFLPYIEIALFSLFGHYLLTYIVDFFEKAPTVRQSVSHSEK